MCLLQINYVIQFVLVNINYIIHANDVASPFLSFCLIRLIDGGGEKIISNMWWLECDGDVCVCYSIYKVLSGS